MFARTRRLQGGAETTSRKTEERIGRRGLKSCLKENYGFLNSPRAPVHEKFILVKSCEHVLSNVRLTLLCCDKTRIAAYVEESKDNSLNHLNVKRQNDKQNIFKKEQEKAVKELLAEGEVTAILPFGKSDNYNYLQIIYSLAIAKTKAIIEYFCVCYSPLKSAASVESLLVDPCVAKGPILPCFFQDRSK